MIHQFILYICKVFLQVVGELQNLIPEAFSLSCLQICLVQIFITADFTVDIFYVLCHTHAQNKNVMCSGIHFAAIIGFHDNQVFCLSAWKQAPLSSLRWKQTLKSAASGFESRAARKPMLLLLFARGLFRLSANTPAATPLFQLPPRLGSTAYSQYFIV